MARLRRRTRGTPSHGPVLRPGTCAQPARPSGRCIMSNYRFAVLDVAAEPYAVSPQLTARLRIEETTGQRVHAIALRCQVRIEPQRRPYDPAEQQGLLGLFGERG